MQNNTMQIRSNTLGKLQKIKNGTVFDNEFVFLREFIQNVQRSKATNCYITLTDYSIQFSDDGTGCKDPQNIFTLDLSQWDSTSEGFGIGFWSCLVLPQLSKIFVESANWESVADVNKIFETGDLSVEKNTVREIRKGFQVTLYSEYLKDKFELISEMLTNETKYIDNIRFVFNGVTIAKEDMFQVDASFYRNYNSQLFKAVLYPTSNSYDNCLMIFYEKRFVAQLRTGNLDYLGGVIEIKTGKIKLKEPDRTEIIRNDDYHKVIRKIQDYAKELYKEYIALYGIDNRDMEYAIRKWLEPKDYESYLNIDLLDMDGFSRNEEKQEVEMDLDEITSSTVVNESLFTKENVIKANTECNRIVKECKNTNTVETKSTNKTMKDDYKTFKKYFWVGSQDVNEYEKEIAKAKYCGIPVIIAKNRLYEDVLYKRDICHISRIFESLVETFSFYDITLKTQKEINFIKILEPIRIKYHLPSNCFLICELQKKNEMVVNGKRMYKEVIKNSKDSVSIYGCCSNGNVYLDRKALKLSNWQVKDKIGVHELKAILNAVNTIAHELAHYLYGTTDNTIEHFKCENRLQEQIINLYI